MKLTSRKVYSLILFTFLVSFIFFSLPFLNLSPGVPFVYADATDSGFNFFTDMIDVSDNTVNVWTDIDVSAHVPLGATGVLLIYEETLGGVVAFDVRMKGSSDDDFGNNLLWSNNHKYVYVGLDANRIFQQKISGNTGDTYLCAYTDLAVTWFTDAKDYATGTSGSWQTVDLSSDVPSGATGVIMKIKTIGAVWEGGVRHPDSTDNFHDDIKEYTWIICGINSAREIEVYVEDLNVDHFLVGYTNYPVTFNVNWDDVSLGITTSWEDIDVTAETSASANGVFIYHKASAGWHDIYIRENGSTDDRTAHGLLFVDTFEFGGCGLDGDNIFEGWIENVACDFFVVGYTKIGDIYPVNEAVVSNSEFAQNVTIGWINVSVSHANGYGNISDVVTTINTTGGELVNLTWWNTPEGDIFEITYDPINMCVLLDDTNSFTTGSDIWNVSWNIAFRRGTVGFCDVNVTSTSIEDFSTTTKFANEFYLSDFQRATGLMWSKDLGNFYAEAWDYVCMDDTGDTVAVGEHYIHEILIYNSSGSLLRTFEIYNVNASWSSPIVEMSGDGKYVVYHERYTAGDWNLTMFEVATGDIVWTEHSTSELASVIDINYNGSITMAITDTQVKLYSLSGYIWNCTTMNGILLPKIKDVSVSRTGDVISAGSDPDGVRFDNASVFMWNSSSSEPMWVWNDTRVSASECWEVEVNEIGDYICAMISSVNYASDIIIFDSTTSTPLHNETILYMRTYISHYSMDFVAQETKEEFYIVAVGDVDANTDVVNCMMYNLTDDTFTVLWNYTMDDDETQRIQLSNIMHNEMYYLATSGELGVKYWDSSSNNTIWTYWNATQDGFHDIDMNRDGNRFFVSATKIQASSDNFVDYFGYEGELPFFVGSANITNMEGCGTWIFSDERFYQVEGNFTHVIDPTMLSHVGLRFTDGYNTFYLWYNVSARSDPNIDAYDLIISPQFDSDKNPGAIDTTTSSATYDDAELTVVWKFWPTLFSFDAMDIDIYAFMNDTVGNQIDWSLEESDLFNLYVLGGFTNSTNVGDAGQYQGRSPFDIYTADDSSVLVEVYYRKLEHVHLKYKIWVPDGFIDYDQNWTLDLGMDFCFYGDDTWYKGWKTQVQTFGGSEIATGNNKWINYTVEHYRYNPTGPIYEPMKQGKMYAYWEGYKTGRDFFQLYTDLWFSSANRSRMWGARVNSVYFGMKNEALFGLGWLFGNDWRAMKGNFTDISHKDNIMDYSGVSWGDHRYTTEIVMCRFWMNLSRIDTEFAFYVRVQDYSSLDFNRLQTGQFEGIDDPVLIETAVPYMGEPGGLLGNFFGWLMETASVIIEGLTIGIMSGIGIFVSFLDTLFGLAGWEGGASTIVGWITSFIDWIILGFSYVIDIMVSLFSIMATWLVLGIQRFVAIGTGLTVIYSNLVWIYTQANAGWVDASEIVIPLLPLLPLGFFIWLLNSRDVEHLFHKVSMCWNFVRTIIGFFVQIGQYTIQLISAIIEAIQW